MDTLGTLVERTLERTLVGYDRRAVIASVDTPSQYVQWRTFGRSEIPDGLSVEVSDPGRLSRTRWWRRRAEDGALPALPLTEDQVATLAHLGFRRGRPGYRCDVAVATTDHDQVADLLVIVLQDVLDVTHPVQVTVEVF
ncbi:TY-Chap domain-containing protein [Nocardia blacklockiae]|uniref:TY-Chap domain-containing protein n=1 Tax=Nocardia blacklockiae TaxID=480036 RepID=UPI0018961FA3|nr:hypothetical protein [Nocardia blacklockiae]MBF6170670.1 hypothetical protein [Nocardia blacklockiae]